MASKPVFDDVPSWPDKPSPAPAHIGHNKPPLEDRIAAEFREALISERPDFYQKVDDLLGREGNADNEPTEGALQRAQCTDAEEYARCGVLVNSLRKCSQLVERVHKVIKQPYLDGGRLVDAQKNSLTARFESAMRDVECLQKDYVREQERLAEIERQEALEDQRKADALRAELEALAEDKGLADALPPAPEPTFIPETYNPLGLGSPVRTDGATVSAGKEWVIDAVDVVKAIKHCKANAKVIEAVTASMKALVKSSGNNGGKGFTGVSARQDVKVNNR